MIRAEDARRAAEARWAALDSAAKGQTAQREAWEAAHAARLAAAAAAANASATEENERWLALGVEMGAAADAMASLDGELEQVLFPCA